MKNTFQNYIGGKWIPCSSGKMFPNYNPSKKEECLGWFQLSDESDVNRTVESAQIAFEEWKNRTPKERMILVEKFLKSLLSHKEELGRIVTMEEGKTLKESKQEIMSAVKEAEYALGYYGSLTSSAAESSFAESLSLSRSEPLGVVSIISPWNFPVNVMCRKTLPALLSGNCVVFKPASFTPWSGIFMAQLFEKSGFPSGVFNCITGSGSSMSKGLICNPQVKAVSFTGSTEAGRKINELAASSFTRTQLELGGKNALIVEEDADLEKAAEAVVLAGYGCSGQWCTSTSRILVSKNIASQFSNILVEKVKKIKVGYPTEPETDMGPVAGSQQYEYILECIKKTKSEGARLLCGGGQVKGKYEKDGYFINPTLFADVTPEMTIFREEIFGPVISITIYETFAEALKLLNYSSYGLSSSIFTNDISKAMEYSCKANTGMTHVNIHTGYKEPCLPFGGWKNSGNGRPENGQRGIEFFTQEKAIYFMKT